MSHTGELEILTGTKRGTFKACKRAFLYRHEMRLRSRVTKGGRRRGGAFAAALDAVAAWNQIDAETVEDVRLPTLEEVIEASLVESYGAQYPNTQDESDELEFEQHALRVLVYEYLQRYGIPDHHEVIFKLPLLNPATGKASRTFLRGGKIDGVKKIAPKTVDIIEDKLYQQVNENMIGSLSLDEQTCEYLDAFLQMDWAVRNVRYRYTRWPSIRRKQKETLDEFCSRFVEDIATRPTFYFDEQIVIFPTDQMEEYRRERWQVGQDILAARALVRRGVPPEQAFYRNPSRCDSFGAGCQFTPLCTCLPDAMDLYIVEDSDTPELEVA